MNYENLTVKKDGHVAVVTLRRPDNLNALSIDLMTDIESVAEHFREDLDTRVVIFNGAGKHFSAGADLKDPKRAIIATGSMLEKQRRFDIGPRMIRRLTEIPQITIAAIHGVALGGGACITAALDFRIGAEDCRVGYPEINLGIPLSWVSLPLCVNLVGPAKAKRLVILGKKENAQTLLEWGFLDEVVPGDKLMERAEEMADEYAAQAPVAAQMIKRSINAIARTHDEAIMHMDSDQVLLAQMTDDFGEGIKAFLEKRKPQYKGK